MSANSPNTILVGLYTLTPTHCGTGQTRGAVDLPIVRESHTGHPVVPATTVKGVVRDRFQRHKSADVLRLFGPATDSPGGLQAGQLIFTEAKLLAFPVRSLNRAYFYVTCPLVLQRLERDLRAFGLGSFLGQPIDKLLSAQRPCLAQPLPGNEQLLVIEDLAYSEFGVEPQLGHLARALGRLLPQDEDSTRRRLADSLILVPDGDFRDLVERTAPVHARIKLNAVKTTGTYHDPATGREDKGNLWYEESLPADCLLSLFVRQREAGALDLFTRAQVARSPLQIGGNETVGQGQCWWTEVAP